MHIQRLKSLKSLKTLKTAAKTNGLGSGPRAEERHAKRPAGTVGSHNVASWSEKRRRPQPRLSRCHYRRAGELYTLSSSLIYWLILRIAAFYHPPSPRRCLVLVQCPAVSSRRPTNTAGWPGRAGSGPCSPSHATQIDIAIDKLDGGRRRIVLTPPRRRPRIPFWRRCRMRGRGTVRSAPFFPGLRRFVDSALHPSGVSKLSTGFGDWARPGMPPRVAGSKSDRSLRDPTRHASSHIGEANCKLLWAYSVPLPLPSADGCGPPGGASVCSRLTTGTTFAISTNLEIEQQKVAYSSRFVLTH